MMQQTPGATVKRAIHKMLAPLAKPFYAGLGAS